MERRNCVKMGKLILTMGNIASGKSTWCRQQAAKGAVIVCNDDITTMVHGGAYEYDDALKPVYKAIEIAAVTAGLVAGKTVIIDRLNHTKDQRKKWIGLASAFDVESHAIIFPHEDPKIHAKRRFDSDSRGRSYDKWLGVAKWYYDNFEYPTLDEGLKHILTVEEIYDQGL